MDPAIATFISIFGPALWKVFETLLEKGKDQLLDQGFAPFKEWIEGGYQARQQEEQLRQIILDTLEELKESGVIDRYDSLFATLKLTGLDEKTRLMLTGATVEMTQYSTSLLPPELFQALEIREGKAELLARFLFTLREKLAKWDKYKDGIRYANDMDKIGLLRGISSQMAAVAERLESLSTMEAALLRDRHLTTDDKQALTDYLIEMRLKWEGLMLPLLRKKSGDITSAKLKQVFVPLSLRDVRAEETARKRMERARKPEKMDDEQTRLVEIGELLNRYERFILIGPPGCGKTTLLDRLALAFVEGRAADELKWQGEALFPLFLRLRNFGAFIQQRQRDFPEPSSGALIAYLENQLRVGERILLTAAFLDHRLDEGNCIVLMDGLDEVSDMRGEVVGHIDAFIARYGNKGNRFGLASRPRGYESVEMQLRRCNLALAEVNPMGPRGIRDLIGNLLVLIEPDKTLREVDQDNLARAIGASEELTRIAGTPLFCSALVQVYKYHGARLPNRRVDVFDEIVDLLLGYWRAQQRHLSQAEQLAIADGTSRHYREVKDAVAVKQRRLSHLADYMQRHLGQAEISREAAEAVLFEYLKQRERVPDDETARLWAENFLISSHELSGLLVERDPGIYTFLHKGFMEYLAAGALVNQSKTLVETVLEHITDEWWEQVILLAGAHPKLAEDVRIELIGAILDKASTCKEGGEEHLRHLVMAGRMARDMAEYLPGPEHELVEGQLYTAATDVAKKPSFRADVADCLDEMGYQPGDLHTFVPIPSVETPDFLIAKYPLTNGQYTRFLKKENFENKELWCNFPKFDESGKRMSKDFGEEGWDWLQKELGNKENQVENGVLAPRYWRDLRFGSTRPSAPVVGVSWYEANAYCKWLLAHWDELEERQDLPRPKVVRLPTGAEWQLAAGGAEPKERFPWDEVGQVGTTSKDDKVSIAKVVQHANVYGSGINHTTPVWCYPQGKSQPYGLMDLGGNVWEWMANYRDKSHAYLGLSGGSWSSYWDLTRVSEWYFNSPDDGDGYIGFRLVVLPSFVS